MAEDFHKTRAGRVIRFIETYCLTPDGMHVGKPIKLADFQKKFITDVYNNPDGTTRAILSIARKNGKTALIACLVLAHLVGPESRKNSSIASGARSRDQAAIVFDLAAKMVRLSPRLRELVRIVPSQKRLIGLAQGTEYRALSADGKRAHGASPVMAILDEVGQVRGPQDDFVDAIITSQGAHDNPLLVAISTQAPGDADLLSIWIDDAKDNADPHTVCHVYAAPESCELNDRQAWESANPALGQFRSVKDMEQMAEQAERMPSMANTFRNLFLNQRISATAPFISRDTWKSCEGVPIPLSECEEVYAALDLSARTDLTACVYVGIKDGISHVHPVFWTPEKGLSDRAARDRAPYTLWQEQGHLLTTPGATVDYEYVAHAIAETIENLPFVGLCYDRWRIDVIKKEFERMNVDIPLKEWGQGFKDMSPALDAVEALLLNGKIRHGAHPVLTMCAANSKVVRNPAGDRKLERIRNGARIDGMVALAMACGYAQRTQSEVGSFDKFIAAPLVLR